MLTRCSRSFAYFRRVRRHLNGAAASALRRDATTNAAASSSKGGWRREGERGMLVALVVGLVVRVGARRNRRWSSYNSIFYFVAFAEVFAGCGGPLPSLLPLFPCCWRHFSYWKAQCRMNAFAYLQIALCSSHCICICVSAAVAAAAALSVSRSSSSSWGVWRASTVAKGGKREEWQELELQRLLHFMRLLVCSL